MQRRWQTDNQHDHSGQFWWPSLGKSYGRRWAVFMAATGQILMTVDRNGRVTGCARLGGGFVRGRTTLSASMTSRLHTPWAAADVELAANTLSSANNCCSRGTWRSGTSGRRGVASFAEGVETMCARACRAGRPRLPGGNAGC
jgi:hypothetical protein